MHSGPCGDGKAEVAGITATLIKSTSIIPSANAPVCNSSPASEGNPRHKCLCLRWNLDSYLLFQGLLNELIQGFAHLCRPLYGFPVKV